MDKFMDSESLAQYMEATSHEHRPWLLLQLRLKKLQERRAEMTSAEYIRQIEELHQDLMGLGEWWVGREEEVFGSDP